MSDAPFDAAFSCGAAPNAQFKLFKIKYNKFKNKKFWCSVWCRDSLLLWSGT
jgi:hypothetical protein